MFSYKKHGRGILAVCDANILGKTFLEGDLEFHVSHEFYGGEECGLDEFLRMAERAESINAAGNDVVNLMIKAKIIKKENTIKIGDISHAQIFVIR